MILLIKLFLVSLLLVFHVDAYAVNYFNWDVESNSTSVGNIEGYLGATTQDCTVAHNGSCSMKIVPVGDDGGNDQLGTGIPDFSYGTFVGSPGLYYRWWMRIDSGFSWGSGTAKAKASRVVSSKYTGYISDSHFLIAECDSGGCTSNLNDIISGDDDTIKIAYDFTSMDDSQWHEYVVFVKPNSSATCVGGTNCDAEFKVWVDGEFIGEYVNFKLNNTTTSASEAWGGWMIKPYFQLNGTSSDGGTIYLDDFSVDSEWNSEYGQGGGGPTTGECEDWQTNHADWLWCDDFETASFQTNYANYSITNLSQSSTYAKEGSSSLKFQYTNGQTSEGYLWRFFGSNPAGTQSHDGSNFNEIYWRFYMFLESGWTGNPYKVTRATMFTASNWSQGMVAHLWQGTGNVIAVDPASGVSGSTVVTSGYNDTGNFTWLGKTDGTTDIYSSLVGEWVCIENYVKLNTPGSSDGVHKVWINGILDINKTGLNWRGSYTTYGINAIQLESYWNGGALATQARYYDNFVISTQRIGFIDTPASLRAFGSGGNVMNFGGGSTITIE
jgi:hypothetical protein